MPATLTENEFSKHVNTKFRVELDAENSVDLELTEVKNYISKPNEHTGMERFSIYFQGPAEPDLPQKLYPADVARLVLWLAAEDSRSCTAQRWVVDGGWT